MLYNEPQLPIDDNQSSIPVTCMDFDAVENCLYTGNIISIIFFINDGKGDEKGYVACWDMKELIDKANFKYSSRINNTPNNSGNISINVSYI